MSSPNPVARPRRRSPLSQIIFWAIVLLGVSVPLGFGLWAVQQLLYPLTQDLCQNVWQAETASIRLSCAETRADSRDAEALLEAIRIAGSISPNDPLRSRSDRLIQQWSADLLELAEAAYQDGNLGQAEDWVQALPPGKPVSKQAEQRLRQWRSNWTQAQNLYQQAEEQLERGEWSEVMALGRELLKLGNRYWATTKYQELMDNLAAARENRPWMRQTARKPEDKSKQPNDLMAKWKREAALEDQNRLKQARSLAGPGKLDDIRAAISEASLILDDSPSYAEAQQLIKGWERQVAIAEDQVYLDRAQDLAQVGDVLSLRSAINELDWIERDRPLYPEAQQLIQQWKERLVNLNTQPTPDPGISPPTQVQPVSTDPPVTPTHTSP